MKNHNLLLFYFVPWLPLGVKTVLLLESWDVAVSGIFVLGISAFYIGWFAFLAFQWGRRKQLWLLLLGCGMQYGVDRMAGSLLLGEELWRMETFAGILYLVAGFWQAVLYFCGRKESLKV